MAGSRGLPFPLVSSDRESSLGGFRDLILDTALIILSLVNDSRPNDIFGAFWFFTRVLKIVNDSVLTKNLKIWACIGFFCVFLTNSKVFFAMHFSIGWRKCIMLSKLELFSPVQYVHPFSCRTHTACIHSTSSH